MADLLSYALTSLSDVKETLGIASSVTTYDNLIKRKINQATEMIEGYCGRRFAATDYVEYYDGQVIDQLVLRQRPVNTVTALSYRNTTRNEDTFTAVDPEWYFTDNNAGIIEAIVSFWGGYDRWRVVYNAGYTTIPSDLAEACATLAAYLYSNDASQIAGVTSKKEGTREIQYGNSKVQWGTDGASANNVITQLGLQVTLDRYSEKFINGLR